MMALPFAAILGPLPPFAVALTPVFRASLPVATIVVPPVPLTAIFRPPVPVAAVIFAPFAPPLSIVVAPAVVTLHAWVARSVRRVSQARRRHARHQQQRQTSLFHVPTTLSTPRIQTGPNRCP